LYKLAISTSGEYVSAAIFEDKLLASFVSKTNRGSTGILLNQINELFDKTMASRKDLSALYLDVGPGYYTGLRIGLSVSQGLGAVLGIPIIPVNGLDALAFAAHTSHRKICSLIDIKRNEFAYCEYMPVPGGVTRESDPRVISVESLEIKLSDDADKKLLVGNWDLIENKKILTDSNTKLAEPRFVTAENIYNVGEKIKDYPNFNEINLKYMREPDVTLSKDSLSGDVKLYD
jgi:tRNA threonylcarbamoyl adenosine modification protein YeaZ